MIPETEIRREAARFGVDPAIVDLDYVLGCLLATLFRQAKASRLVFKGGTCLKKCYHQGFRFSKDLDFTLTARLGRDEVHELVATAAQEAREEWDIDFGVRPVRVDVGDDEYGGESYQARLYFSGPLRRRRGDPQAIRLDITTSEVIAFTVRERPILHAYGDAKALESIRVSCYDVLEMVLEKMRALCGQRRYAIARDIYDLHYLYREHYRGRLPVGKLITALPAKWRIKGLAVECPNVERITGRETEFREDWDRNLRELLPNQVQTTFEQAWTDVKRILVKIARSWPEPKT